MGSPASSPDEFLAFQLESKAGVEALLVTDWRAESNTSCIPWETPQGALEHVYGNQEEFASLPGHGTQQGLELLVLQALRQCSSKFQMRKCNCQIPVCQKNLE